MIQWIITLEAASPNDVDKITRVVREAAKLGLTYKVRSREITPSLDLPKRPARTNPSLGKVLNAHSPTCNHILDPNSACSCGNALYNQKGKESHDC